jgi:putative ABC transport system permease protein
MMSHFFQDLRFGVRILLRKPGFTLIAIVTLALGIGANTAIFSVVNAVLIRPLPYLEPDRLVSLWETQLDKGVSRFRVAPANFLDWQSRNQSMEAMAAFSSSSLTLTGSGEPEQLGGASVSEGYFSTLGVQPALGRAFLPEEHKSGRGQVVILDHGLWQRRFGADSRVIGKTILLDGSRYEIVGIMPSGIYPTQPATVARLPFDPSRQQYFVPMRLEGEWAANRRSHVLGVIGRLKNGVSLEQARAEMTALGSTLAEDYAANRGEGVLVTRFIDEVVGEARPAILILFGAVAVVLLIACANVAGLLVAQIVSRRREIAVRCALGASRARIIRQFLSEALLLALGAGALGVWLASLGVDGLMRIIPLEIPRLEQVTIDRTALVFTLVLSIITSLIVSLVPALQASKPDLQNALKEGARSSTGDRKFRRSLVIAQVALAVVLVVSATLLMKSFGRLRSVDPGFDPDHTFVASLTLPQSKYGQWQRVIEFYDQLVAGVKSIPGVKAAAIGYDHPLQTNWIDSFTIERRLQTEQSPSADLHLISPDYFDAIGIALKHGRTFTQQDDVDHAGAVIINEAFAARYFPDEDPLGQRITATTASRMVSKRMPSRFEIVGVVQDVKSHGLAEAVEPAYYIPARQFPQADMQVFVRTDGDPVLLTDAFREQVRIIDVDQPVSSITTMERLLSNAVAQPRFNMVMMGLFGGLALTLAAIGIYGLLAQSVNGRTREIGVRMALGAQPADVLRSVIGEGMVLSVTGTAAGLVIALATTRLMSKLLFEVSATDPATFVVITLLLLIVALLACYIPARRATKVDPMVALRCE